MNISEFQSVLRNHSDHGILFVFDDGETIPSDFHITEVGHVQKSFIDCGGAKRKSEACMLQAWVAANDKGHRLPAGKLADIIEMARSILPSHDLPVELEYEACVISQYEVSGFEVRDQTLRFALVDKHTDCLAKEACGLEATGCGCNPVAGKCC
jgi:hypothetical protein